MNVRLKVFAVVWVLSCLALGPANANRVSVDDAYVRIDDARRTWAVGTAALEIELSCAESRFRLVSLKNKLTNPAREYVDAQSAMSPFALDPLYDRAPFEVKPIWEKYLPNAETADPGAEPLRLRVHKGDRIGFAVGPHESYQGDQTEWSTTVDYGDGESYTSAQDAGLNQGPIWFYCLHPPDTGLMIPIEGIEWVDNAKENVRIPNAASPLRAPGNAPHVGATMFHPANEMDVVRVWQAPKDGTVTLRGRAKHLRGFGDVDLKILQIRPRTADTKPARVEGEWSLVSVAGRSVEAGGRPAVQLDIALARDSLQAVYHLLAFPRTALVRQWVDLTNTGAGMTKISSPSALTLRLRGEEGGSFLHHWMMGGNSLPDEGMLHTAPVTNSYQWHIIGHKTDNYTPWMSFQRKEDPRDGWFFVQDYLGSWRFAVDRDAAGPMRVSASIASSTGPKLAPGEKVSLPLITLGVFRDSLEDMGERVYNWQYEYLWDYTHDDWYGLMPIANPWYNDVHNLQENFAGRLADLDFKIIDDMRTTGMELLWDDAGWSENPNIWTPSREGPDFLNTQRYLAKAGMRWLLWFCGEPSGGLMDTKVGSWGDFQWRTDGQPGFGFEMDARWRHKITQFLKRHPQSSFHTCSGGSRYAHCFEPQRFADINMFTDPGGGDQSNYYLSYLETPDKWMDVVPPLITNGKYRPDTSRQLLTMVPAWDRRMATTDDLEQLRRLCDVYRFLTREGVAGRWTYMLHPAVKGDTEFFYSQRISHDRTKSCILLKHRAPGRVVIYPKGLLPGLEYTLGFDSTPVTAKRTGRELMGMGISLEQQAPGELIYLNLPYRPGSGHDKEAPKSPARVLLRRESNIGYRGVGVFWSPGSDNHWISYYEVRRGTQILGKVSFGTYFFDHFPGWDAETEYAVRTVDGDGNAGEWAWAQTIPDEPFTAFALGGHFAERGREGWSSETTPDNRTFAPMTFIPPIKDPAGNSGGTGKQIGGVEGYWEGANTARTGRGWQQASTSARCVRTWTAPQPGHVRIVGRAMKEYYRRKQGGPLRVCILHGERQIWPNTGWAVVSIDDLHGVSHDLSLNVVRGEAIRFVLDTGSSPENDVVCWMPRIIYAEPEPIDPNATVTRLLCGAAEPYIDSNGNAWSADRFFTGGQSLSTRTEIAVAPSILSDPALYRSGRQGKDFTYSIPVKPGLYTVRVKFAEPEYLWFFQRPFNLSINGRRVMRNADICHSARGARRAHDRIYRYVVPDGDGRIGLRFTGGFDPLQQSDQAIVQAIEVVPEIKPAIRIDAGAARPFVDWNSLVWDADSHFQGGRLITSEMPISQAAPTLHDQKLYQTARIGQEFSYTVSVLPGLYSVHLKFAELWLTQVGRRPMNIEINGYRVWEKWDPAAAAEQIGMAADIRADAVTPDKDNRITIRVTAAGENEAILQGIQIE